MDDLTMEEIEKAFKDILEQAPENVSAQDIEDIAKRLGLEIEGFSNQDCKERVKKILEVENLANKGTANGFKIYEDGWDGWWKKIGHSGVSGVYSIDQTKHSTGEHLTGQGKAFFSGPPGLRLLIAEKTAASDGNLCWYRLPENAGWPGPGILFSGTYRCHNGSGFKCDFRTI